MLIALLLCVQARASQLVINGGFETGDLTGWTLTTESGSSGELVAWNSTTNPLSPYSTVGPASGSWFALTDQNGPGAYSLTQSFTVVPGSTVIFSFDLFANANGPVSTPASLDYNTSDNEQARVDLLSGSASAFALGAAVLENLYDGADSGTNPNPYTSYSFDISSEVAAGGTFQIRFAEADNAGNFNLGVDNVSLDATSSPEPATVGMVFAGLMGMAAALRRRRAASAGN